MTAPLFVEEIAGGDRAPVVLLHSSGLSRRQWRKLAPALAKSGFPVIMPDLAGHGDSPPREIGSPTRHDEDIEWLGQFLEARGPAHVVGHSYGGLIAAAAAARAPERVLSLVLIEPVTFAMLGPEDEEARRELQSIDFRWDAPFDADRWLETFVDYWSGKGAWRGMREEARTEWKRVAWPVHETVRTLMTDAMPREAYARVTAPVTLIYGEATTLASRTVTARLAATFPHATRHAIPGAGHMSPLTHPDRVFSIVHDSLRSV